MLAGYGPAVSHELAWVFKPGQLAQFSHDRRRRHLRNTAHCLQRFYDLSHVFRSPSTASSIAFSSREIRAPAWSTSLR